MGTVDIEVAKLEVEKWLDYKKIRSGKRQSLTDNIESLEEAICEGIIVLDDKMNLVHHLLFPLEKEDDKVEILTYKPRIKLETLHIHLQGVKPGDADGRITAYIAAVSGQTKGLIKKLDTEDSGIAQAIALFFI